MCKLTNREVEVITYSAHGCTAKDIARLTGLEYRTVEAYMSNIRKKLHAKNIAHAVFIACHENVLNMGLTYIPVRN